MSKNVNVYCPEMQAFLNTIVWCLEMLTFHTTEYLVSKNTNISQQTILDVQKCNQFFTPNIWCLEKQKYLDRENLVSKNANNFQCSEM